MTYHLDRRRFKAQIAAARPLLRKGPLVAEAAIPATSAAQRVKGSFFLRVTMWKPAKAQKAYRLARSQQGRAQTD